MAARWSWRGWGALPVEAVEERAGVTHTNSTPVAGFSRAWEPQLLSYSFSFSSLLSRLHRRSRPGTAHLDDDASGENLSYQGSRLGEALLLDEIW